MSADAVVLLDDAPLPLDSSCTAGTAAAPVGCEDSPATEAVVLLDDAPLDAPCAAAAPVGREDSPAVAAAAAAGLEDSPCAAAAPVGGAPDSPAVVVLDDGYGDAQSPPVVRRMRVRCRPSAGGRDETLIIPLGPSRAHWTCADLLTEARRRACGVPSRDIASLELDGAGGGRLHHGDVLSQVLQPGDALCTSALDARAAAAARSAPPRSLPVPHAPAPDRAAQRRHEVY